MNSFDRGPSKDFSSDLRSELMAQVGLSTETGPHVDALREKLAEKQRAGVTRMNVWWRGDRSGDERARELLRLDWEIDHGHSYRTEALDGLWWVSTNLRTGRRRLVIDWRWFGDVARMVLCDLRKAWHHAIGLKNPYAGRLTKDPPPDAASGMPSNPLPDLLEKGDG